jgi:hypothetical protein
MKKVFFFVHIPKTAGTSFRKTIEKNEQVAMFYDYGEKSPESTPALLEKVRDDESLNETSVFFQNKLNVICGHVIFKKYAACVRTRDVLAIMRNPIERVVSEYQHLTRHANLSKNFTQFILSPQQINKQSKMLGGIDISSGAIIGLTSHYEQFLNLASQRLNVTLETSLLNKAPVSDMKERLRISPAEINHAFELNRKDLTLFRNVAISFHGMLQQHGVKTVPENGLKGSFRINSSGQLVGWVGRSDQECFFVVLTVDNKFRAIVGLDQPRKEVARRGLSKSEICGFSYPLSLLGASPGSKVGLKILGAPQFRKTLVVPSEKGAP